MTRDRKQLSFREKLQLEFHGYLQQEAARFNPAERLKIDFHCHDRNSDVPDELWGRLLGLPETWLKTKDLVSCLQGNGCDVITITNHNNARSCWDLLDKGQDVLVGTEFTCHFNEYELYMHVLTYGFTPEQEVALNKKRRDIYAFLRYTTEHNIPVILPHPLYFYSRTDKLDPEMFEKLALLFQRYEVLNGQRDLWQSVLVLNWTRGLTEEKLHWLSKKHDLNPLDFGVDIVRPKILTGGSDDHMGLSAGQSGSYLHVPNLAERRKTTPLSQLALEAIRKGQIAPYGHVGENQRLNVALLDYFSQIVTHMQDPGLLRLMLHRGDATDKLACLVIGNIFLEIKKHKKTQRFIGCVHDALRGKKPDWLLRLAVSRDYAFCVRHLDEIAASRHLPPDQSALATQKAISEMFTGLSQLIVARTKKCAAKAKHGDLFDGDFSSESLIRKFEIPLQFRSLAFGDAPGKKNITGINIGEILDNLSFPVMVNLVLLAAQLASTRVLYANRGFLNEFSSHIGRNQHPRRALYLTDTLRDKNGVSNSLSAKLAEIQRQDYPVDFLICHPDAKPESHLHVVRPLAEFGFPSFGEQQLRVPDLLEIAKIFYEGGYDRVVCSTEGPMALVALFLKYKFNVPAYFFMHTDWLDFFRHTTNLDSHELDRIRRVMRALYHQFEGVFVLNTDHRKWLNHSHMGLPKERVHLTAHHVEQPRRNIQPVRKSELFADASNATPVLFMAGRLSKEKGVLELPEIVGRAREQIPELRIVIAGVGPAEAELREQLPDAAFLGWVSRERIEQLYAGLDLFVFPSRFDTFGNVVLEAFSQGMPVLAYNCKGPKDIIENGSNGYLVEKIGQMSAQIVSHFAEPERHAAMRSAALRRVDDYQAGPIMRQFMHDLGLPVSEPAAAQLAAA
jgi:glycosyltransferase involved in cell wall biosynthesis